MNRVVRQNFFPTRTRALWHGLCPLLSLLINCGLLLLPLRAPAANAHVKQVIVVFKTHFDIGYTDLVTNVLTRYRTTFLDGALKLIDASRSLPPEQQFVWTVPGWPLEQMLWPGQTPERRQRVLQALKEGRLAVHAMPFTLQTESLDLEDLVRGLRFSADIARDNGLPLPRAGKMTDVPEHCWVLPTLLTHAGITFLHIGCNGGSKPMQVPPLFWWVGPDGSRLLTAYSPQYGTGLRPPADWPYQTWLAMIMTGDNHGPPSAAEVDKLLKQAASELPGVKVKFGRLEDFHDAIIAEHNDHIPVVRGDMPDTWIHGFEAMPKATKLAWDVRPLEQALATLDTQLRAAGLNPPSLSQPLAEAYEKSLLYSEHTFGYFGSQPGGFWYGEDWQRALAEGKYNRFEQSFEDKRDYIRTTARIVTNALNERLGLLAQNVSAGGPRICVFNPLPWKRSGEVALTLPQATGVELAEAATGRHVKLLGTDDASLRFLAEDIPPSGYKTYQVLTAAQARLPQTTTRELTSTKLVTIESQNFRLQVDPRRGCITSLRDIKSGHELVAANDSTGFGEYLHERFSSNNVEAFIQAYCRLSPWVYKDFGKPGMPGPDQAPYAEITLSNWTAVLHVDAVGKSIILRCADATPLAKTVTLKYTLYTAQPYLDLEWSIENKTPNPLPEGGWLCLPFAIDNPHFTLARLGSLTDPAKDVLPGANRHMFCLNSGLTITGPDGFGIGLCPLDSPLVSLGEPGLWKFSMDWVPTTSRVFINLYNNQWDTNFPLWQQGSWTSRVRLWLVPRANNPSHDLLTPAWEARAPLLATWAQGAGGRLPATASGLAISRQGVLATCFGPAPYSDKLLLRVWELAGRSGPLTVTLPTGLNALEAVPVNLRGEPAGKPIKIQRGTFSLALPAFSPATFRLEPVTEK